MHDAIVSLLCVSVWDAYIPCLDKCKCMHCIILQITEKLYRQLEPRTKKLRFTVPFPLLAFPVYLVCCCLLGAEINKVITSN